MTGFSPGKWQPERSTAANIASSTWALVRRVDYCCLYPISIAMLAAACVRNRRAIVTCAYIWRHFLACNNCELLRLLTNLQTLRKSPQRSKTNRSLSDVRMSYRAETRNQSVPISHNVRRCESIVISRDSSYRHTSCVPSNRCRPDEPIGLRLLFWFYCVCWHFGGMG